MLAGTVYFYGDKDELIKEIDLEDYEDLSEEEFYQMIQDVRAFKVILNAFYHNHHRGTKTVLYPKDNKQT